MTRRSKALKKRDPLAKKRQTELMTWYWRAHGALEARRIDLRRVRDVYETMNRDVLFWEDALEVIRAGEIDPLKGTPESNHRLLIEAVARRQGEREPAPPRSPKMEDLLRIIEDQSVKDIQAKEDADGRRRMDLKFERGSWKVKKPQKKVVRGKPRKKAKK